LLAERGLTGPHSIFDGQRGTLASYGSPGADAAGLLDGLGRVWLTPGTTYKVYPCCSLCQAAMDAARALQRQYEFAADDLVRVECFVSAEAFGIVCEPRRDKLSPKTPYQAAFSLPFCVAVALLDEVVSVESFHQERLDDSGTLGLAERVACVADSGLSVGDGQPARVAITLRDGRSFERFATLRGTPQNPFSATQVEAKFRHNADHVLPSDQLSATVDRLRNLELVENMDELTTLLAAAAVPVQR
jgi:2-methylcitrate dehydratase PrpD